MSASRLRLKLLAIVSQAWLIGGGATTALAFFVLSFVPGTYAGLGLVIASAPVAMIFSAPLYLVSLLIVLPAPSFTMRFRRPLCLGCLALVGTGAVLVVRWTVSDYTLPLIAMLDAIVATLWCWRRSAHLLVDGDAALRRTFG